MTWFAPDFGYITLVEGEDNVVATVDNGNVYDFMMFLEENNFSFDQENNIFFIYDSFDEIYEEFIEYEVSVYLIEEAPDQYMTLTEGGAKRKVVIRKGKRKVIFQCEPGQKKVGRRCVRRPSKDLQKLKRRARRAARKGKSKRSSALRKRKLSLKRRKSFDHKTKSSSKENDKKK